MKLWQPRALKVRRAEGQPVFTDIAAAATPAISWQTDDQFFALSGWLCRMRRGVPDRCYLGVDLQSGN
jgi:hypothetical protein